MKFGRRILSAVMAATLLVATACSQDTTWVAEYEETKLPAGVYNLYLLDNYSAAYAKVEDATADNILSQQIDGITAEQWIKDQSAKNLNSYFAIEKKFDEYGLSFTEDELNSVKEYVASLMESDQEFFTKNGISATSLELYFLNNYKSNTLFYKLYGEGGEREVSTEELKKYFEENYTYSQFMYIPKFDQETFATLEGDALEAVKKEAQGYYDRMTKGEETFDQVFASWEEGHNQGEAHDHNVILGKTDFSTMPEEYNKLVQSATVGTPVMGEDDYYYYILVRKDIHSNEENLKNYTQQLLLEMKTEDYKALMAEWSDALTLKLNQAALNLYTPKKLSLDY